MCTYLLLQRQYFFFVLPACCFFFPHSLFCPILDRHVWWCPNTSWYHLVGDPRPYYLTLYVHILVICRGSNKYCFFCTACCFFFPHSLFLPRPRHVWWCPNTSWYHFVGVPIMHVLGRVMGTLGVHSKSTQPDNMGPQAFLVLGWWSHLFPPKRWKSWIRPKGR
jgi:hypothetical protein